MKEITVADVMTRNPLTVRPETDLLECIKKMLKNKRGALLITDKNKKLMGFISQKDVLWVLAKKPKQDLKKIKAIDISVKKLITIRPKATLEEALKKMKKYKRLPVVQKEELVGIVSAKDLLSYNSEFYPELEEFSKIREESEKLKRLKNIRQKNSEGYCEECGNYSSLSKSGRGLVCEECGEK
ncbi:CBS domain-containing protein [Candidatus Pacearchaeota archaeon]|nr:CBS domain-containing protein [Candidatus Pacearchaeota archaeon]